MIDSKPWAVVRIVLGTLQVTAATTGVILLVRSGVNEFSIGAAVVASILTLTSVLLFRRRRQ